MGTVHPLPGSVPSDDRAQQEYCRRPGCSNVLAQGDTGRPKVFCSTQCRQRNVRDRAQAERQVAAAQRILDQFDPAPSHPPTRESATPTARPPDRAADLLITTREEAAQVAGKIVAQLAHEVEMAAARLDALGSAENSPVAARLRNARLEAYRQLDELTD